MINILITNMNNIWGRRGRRGRRAAERRASSYLHISVVIIIIDIITMISVITVIIIIAITFTIKDPAGFYCRGRRAAERRASSYDTVGRNYSA